MCLFIFSIHFILTSTHPIYSTFALGNNDSPTTTKTMMTKSVNFVEHLQCIKCYNFLSSSPSTSASLPIQTKYVFFFLNEEIHFLKKVSLFLAALGLCSCTQVFSSWDEWGLQVAVLRLLTVVASLVVEHGR